MPNDKLEALLKETKGLPEEAILSSLVEHMDLHEIEKGMTNLRLLNRWLEVSDDLFDLAGICQETADPDQALNNLERLTDTVDRDKLIGVLHSSYAGILITTLGASQFLTNILCRNASFFENLFDEGEVNRNKTEIEMEAELQELIADDADMVTLQKGLRLYKCREMLRIGSRDLSGMAGLVEVTAGLSSLAAATLQRACDVCGRQLQSEYGTPMEIDEEGIPVQEAAFTVLGMGKFGGRELNFSSDIDLIYVYSSSRGKTVGGKELELRRYYLKLAELVTKAVGEVTADGFVFRVDLDLRPEGRSGEIAISLPGLEIYYESWGRNWERAAMLKARPVAGCQVLGRRILKSLEPFIYRKYLDFAMLEDLKLMKQKINSSLQRKEQGETNLKLGRGGIREIEFFIQAQQLIHAGKNPFLRERNSLKALHLLYAHDYIDEQDFHALCQAYTFLRTVEHRIQVVSERQTHNLPARENELLALARRSGFADYESFAVVLENHRQNVQRVYNGLFYTNDQEETSSVDAKISFIFDPEADSDYVKDILEEKGFKDIDVAYESILCLRDGPRARLTERAKRNLDRSAPIILQEIIDSPEPDMALRNMEKFLAAVRARGTFYALLAENPVVIKLLISLFAMSSFLSRIFIQHPEILDTLVSRTHAMPYKDFATMSGELGCRLEACNDYEDELNALRSFRNEEVLRIALNDIQGNTLQGERAAQLSFLAETSLDHAVKIARKELIPRFGLPFCTDRDGVEVEASFAIVAMGKLGGRELNYHSDLDIIFIYEGHGENRKAEGTQEHRFKSLSNAEYFSRLAQRVISVLTLMTQEGTVFEIDTRLRPSGNQGPLVTSFSAFVEYHEASAQIWERQALTKARTVSSSPEFARKIDRQIEIITYERPVPEDLRDQILRLRRRMEEEIAREDSGNINIKTGRGGMVDVEFVVQYLQLKYGQEYIQLRPRNVLAVLQQLRGSSLLDDSSCDTLEEGYKFLRRLENKLRLVHDQSINNISKERTALLKLAHRLGYKNGEKSADIYFLEDYRTITEKIRNVFDKTFST